MVDPYESPKSNIEEQEIIAPHPVKKPWFRWLIALWIFIGVGIFLGSVGRQLGALLLLEPKNIKLLTGLLLISELFFIYGIVTLHRLWCKIFAIFCILLATLQTINLGFLAYSQFSLNGILFVLILHIIPAILVARYLYSTDFTAIAKQNEAYVNFKKMRKL